MRDLGDWSPEKRHDDIVVTEVEDEVLVYDERTHRAHYLDPVAAGLWDECDGSRTPAELASRLDTPIECVSHGLRLLADRHLLVEAPTALGDGRLTRRQLLRNLGIAGMVGAAVPIVSTIVAPTAAAAATCLASGQACVSSAECCSAFCSDSICD